MANPKRYRGTTREQQAKQRARYAEWERNRGIGLFRTPADSGQGENYARGQKQFIRYRVNEQGNFEKIKETDRKYNYRQIRAALGLSVS